MAEIKKEEPKKASTFDDEEEEEEEAPVKKAPASKPKPAKKETVEYVDETLADPVAEKLRRQKLVEAADLAAARSSSAPTARRSTSPPTRQSPRRVGTATWWRPSTWRW